MLGLTFSSVTKINQMGYRIIEDASGMETVFLKDGKTIAEISVGTNSFLQIVMGGEKLDGLKWIYVEVTYLPKIILIQAEDSEGKERWGELPLKEGLPVFW